MTRTVEFIITGWRRIHCAGCEARIGRALRRIGGVQDVRASVDRQQVVATIDPGQVAPERLRDKLRELGYDAASGEGA